jgi:hypothetical protein
MGYAVVRDYISHRVITDSCFKAMNLHDSIHWFLLRSFYKPLLNKFVPAPEVSKDARQYFETTDGHIYKRDGEDGTVWSSLTMHVSDRTIIATGHGTFPLWLNAYRNMINKWFYIMNPFGQWIPQDNMDPTLHGDSSSSNDRANRTAGGNDNRGGGGRKRMRASCRKDSSEEDSTTTAAAVYVHDYLQYLSIPNSLRLGDPSTVSDRYVSYWLKDIPLTPDLLTLDYLVWFWLRANILLHLYVCTAETTTTTVADTAATDMERREFLEPLLEHMFPVMEMVERAWIKNRDTKELNDLIRENIARCTVVPLKHMIPMECILHVKKRTWFLGDMERVRLDFVSLRSDFIQRWYSNEEEKNGPVAVVLNASFVASLLKSMYRNISEASIQAITNRLNREASQHKRAIAVLKWLEQHMVAANDNAMNDMGEDRERNTAAAAAVGMVEEWSKRELWSIVPLFGYLLEHEFPSDSRLESMPHWVSKMHAPSIDTLPDYSHLLTQLDNNEEKSLVTESGASVVCSRTGRQNTTRETHRAVIDLLSCAMPHHCTIRPVITLLLKAYQGSMECRSWIDGMLTCLVCDLYSDRRLNTPLDHATLEGMLRFYYGYTVLDHSGKLEFWKRLCGQDNKPLIQCIIQTYLVYCCSIPAGSIDVLHLNVSEHAATDGSLSSMARATTTNNGTGKRRKKTRHYTVEESSECNASLIRLFFRSEHKVIFSRENNNRNVLEKKWKSFIANRQWLPTPVDRRYTSLIVYLDSCLLECFKEIYGRHLIETGEVPVDHICLDTYSHAVIDGYLSSYRILSFVDQVPPKLWIDHCLMQCNVDQQKDRAVYYDILTSYYKNRDSSTKTKKIIHRLSASGFCVLLHFISRVRMRNSMQVIDIGMENALLDAMAVERNQGNHIVGYTTHCCSRVCNSLSEEESGMINTFASNRDFRRHCKHKTETSSLDSRLRYLYFEMFLSQCLHPNKPLDPPKRLLDFLKVSLQDWYSLRDLFLEEQERLNQTLLYRNEDAKLVPVPSTISLPKLDAIRACMNTMQSSSSPSYLVVEHNHEEDETIHGEDCHAATAANKSGSNDRSRNKTRPSLCLLDDSGVQRGTTMLDRTNSHRVKQLINKQAKRFFVLACRDSGNDLVSEENAIGRLLVFRGLKNKHAEHALMMRICQSCGTIREYKGVHQNGIFMCQFCIRTNGGTALHMTTQMIEENRQGKDIIHIDTGRNAWALLRTTTIND